MNQKIEGDGNVQVATLEGDLVVDRKTPIMHPDDPDIVDCPFKCGQLTWWNAPDCWNCGRPVLEYFNNQYRKTKKETLTKRALALGVIGMPLVLFANKLPYLQNELMGVGILAMFVAYALVVRAERL